jgi:hypothetical protein
MGTEGIQIEADSKDHRPDYALVICGEEKDDSIPPAFPVLRSWSSHVPAKLQHLFVLCRDWRLPDIAGFVTEINRQHRLQALFIRLGADPALLPQMLERANLRMMRNILVYSDSLVPRRVLAAWKYNAQSELIANATVADSRLILVSCEPRMYDIGFDQMTALKKIPVSERRNFEIAEDGSFIWWPSGDIHLDLDAIKSVIDPESRRRAERFRRAYGREYGAAIAALRKEHGLKQSGVHGISERQLRRIEQTGDVSVRVLKQLAKAHCVSFNEYLTAVAEMMKAERNIGRSMNFGREDSGPGTAGLSEDRNRATPARRPALRRK